MTSESPKRLALGIDGGGTKCDAVLVDEHGAVLGYGRSGSTQALYVGREAAIRARLEAATSALGDYRPDHLYVTGMWRRASENLDSQVGKIHFVEGHELTMGLAMALQTCGILVLSGTGAFAACRKENGEFVHFDGLGPYLGDYGSGYQIGLHGMRAAMASSWSDVRKTVLAETVPEILGVPDLHGVFNLVYTEHISRTQTASVARAVIRAADQGDAVARRIILQAADDMFATLADVIGRMDLYQSDYAMVASGGIAQTCELYWDRVSERALELAPNLRPIRPRVRPCVGGALLALKKMGVEWTPELLARIEETHRPFLDQHDQPRDASPQELSSNISLEYTPHGPRIKGAE